MNEDHGHFRRQASRDHASQLRHHAASGGDIAQDEALIKKAIDEHDEQLHGGAKTRLKFKRGGHVEGKEARPRLDRARGGRTKKGKGGHKVVVNVVMPQKGDGPSDGGPPMMPPGGMPPHPPMMPPPGGPPPGGPPGGPPMGPPVGAGVPMPHKRGGKVKRQERCDGGRAGRSSGGRAALAMGGCPGDGFSNMPVQAPPMPGRGAPPMPGTTMGAPGMGMRPPMPVQNLPAMGQMPPRPGFGMPGAAGMVGQPVGRKSGGRVPNLEGGAGGAEGRLDKIKAYGGGSGNKENDGASGNGENRKMARGGRR